jgi:hypothetical protein
MREKEIDPVNEQDNKKRYSIRPAAIMPVEPVNVLN